MTDTQILFYFLFLLLPITKGAMPGTFLWRPRMGIDLAIPTTEPTLTAYQPNQRNIQEGIVVLIDGYDIMTSIIGLMQGVQFALDDDAMNPAMGIYYNNVWRWSMRTLHLLPHWIRGNFNDALSVWSQRFKFMDSTVPGWARKMIPWVNKDSWNLEEFNLKRYKKESENAFAPFYRYPSKTFHNFNSFLPDTVEEFLFSSEDRDKFSIVTESSREKKEREEKLQAQLTHINKQTVKKPDEEPENKLEE